MTARGRLRLTRQDKTIPAISFTEPHPECAGWEIGELSFNGINQYVDVGSSVARVTKNFTIASWVNRAADFPSGTFRMWFSEGVDGDGGWAAYIQNNGATHEHRFLKGGRSIVSSAIPNAR